MFKSQKVTVVLAPSALEVVVLDSKGHVDSHARRSIDPTEYEDAWINGLTSLDAPLGALLRSAGVPRGSRAGIVYLGADEVVETRLFDESTKNAARLAEAQMLNELAFDRELAVARSETLRFDVYPQQAVVLSVANRDDRLLTLFAWLQRAGLKPTAACPREAVAVGEAIRTLAQVVACESKAARRVHWHIGEYECVLAVSTRDATGRHQLELVRSIRYGFDSLVEAFARGLKRDRGTGEPDYNFKEARATLLRLGIPSQDQVVDVQTGTTGRDVLPLLQPVLQRMAIEVKQTLRFGLADNKVTLIEIAGPGAELAGMVPILEEFLDIKTERSTSCRVDSTGDGHLLADPIWAEEAIGRVPLVPRSVTQSREAGKIAGALRIGAVAAIGLLGMIAFDAWQTQHQINQQIAAFRPRVERLRHVAETEAQAAELAFALNTVESEIFEQVGQSPDWQRLLDEIGWLCDEDVRLVALSAESGTDSDVIELRGVAAESGAENDQQHLAEFLSRLGASPLLTAVRLESTRMSEFRGRPGRQFVIRAEAVRVRAPSERSTEVAGGGS